MVGSGCAAALRYAAMERPRTGARACRAGHEFRRVCSQKGFSLLEIMMAVAIVTVLAAIAMPNYIAYREKAMIARAIAEIRGLEKEITSYAVDHGTFPTSLAAVGMNGLLDPWGNPYQYQRVEGTPPGKLRKDRFLVPVNSDFDLYSMGKDGSSQPPFTAKASRDDIVRCNNGAYVGLASNY